MLYVKATAFAQYNSVINELLPTITSAYQAVLIKSLLHTRVTRAECCQGDWLSKAAGTVRSCFNGEDLRMATVGKCSTGIHCSPWPGERNWRYFMTYELELT